MYAKPCGIFNIKYAQDMAIIRTRRHWVFLITGTIALFVLPLLFPPSVIMVLTIILVQIISVYGLNILTGMTGQINLGQAAFMGVGAYTCAILANKGMSLFVTIPAGGIAAGLCGLIFGLPSLRLKGFYIAMTTLTSHFIIEWCIIHFRGMTQGAEGIVVSMPRIIGNLSIDSEKGVYWLCLTCMLICTYLVKNIMRTRNGRAFIAIKENDIAAELFGVNVYAYKLLAFFSCTFLGGVAGALWAYCFSFVCYEQFTLMNSIWYLGMLIVGGLGAIMGVIYGVIFITVISHLVNVYSPLISTYLPISGSSSIPIAMGNLVFGFIILLFLIYEPRGLCHQWELFKASYRLHPYSY